MQGDKGNYNTNSLHEACYLRALGARLLEITGSGTRRSFIFDDSQGQARQLSQQFFNDKPIGALTLFKALGELKKLTDATFKKGAK